MAVLQTSERKAECKAERKPKRKAKRKVESKADKQTTDGKVSSPKRNKRNKNNKNGASKTTKVTAAAYLKANEIIIHEENAPLPCLNFEDAPFPAKIVRMLVSQPGFKSPSPVQAATWPIAVKGRDVLAIAKTGSGKTLGFLLPVIRRCMAERDNKAVSPIGLIMAPTRELALQIHAEAVKFGNCVGLRAVAVYGGAKKGPQVNQLRRGCDLIVGTPGRIKDVLDTAGGGQNAVCDVGKMAMLVLDEADRMLDMGFERDIRAIAWQAFAKKDESDYRPHQTFLYSATWPLDVQGIANDLLTNAVKVTVGDGGEKLTASKSIVQRIHVVTEAQRWPKFVELISPFARGGTEAGKRVIVFANRKNTVREITQYCAQQGMAAGQLSGDRSQSQREATIKNFKKGTVTVVIATDVAARGLDIKGIERVINYQLPIDDFQDYVHRIGRTGRANAKGQADSLFTNGDKVHAPKLIKLMKEADQQIPPELANLGSKRVVFD